MRTASAAVAPPPPVPRTDGDGSLIHPGGGHAVRRDDPASARSVPAVSGATAIPAAGRRGPAIDAAGIGVCEAHPPSPGWPQPRTADGLDDVTLGDLVPVEQWGWYTPATDIKLPAPARVYDHLMGGAHTFGADRVFGDHLIRLTPDVRRWARANAAFLARAVHRLAGAGMRQFLDLGCGVAGVASAHDVLCRVAPQARVIHVDIDPIAVMHTHDAIRRAGRRGRAAVVHADIRHPETLVAHADVHRVLDLSRPVGILATAVLHHVDRPGAILAVLREATVLGSHLVVSHLTPGRGRPEVAAAIAACRDAGIPLVPRTRRQIGQLLHGWEPVAPGLVAASQWFPDRADERGRWGGGHLCLLAGVARATDARGRPGAGVTR